MRVAAASLIASLLCGCASPTSVLTVPPCTRKVEIEGQHGRRDATTLVFDHTFDLPFSRTKVVVERPGGVKEEIEIVNSEPDYVRLFVGGALVVIGGVLFTSAGIDAARGRSLLEERPLTSVLWGGAAASIGVAAAATGWHPPHSTIIEDRCRER